MRVDDELVDRLRGQIGDVVAGNNDLIDLLTIALLSRGHIILAGPPGVGKTTIANLFAMSTGLEFNRIQMTSDLLPADLTGSSVYDQQTGEFERYRGPIFANVVLADEINRAPPKTQSALLEAMREHQVTIEGDTISISQPFLVIGTRNTIENQGVFDLSESLRDRFLFELEVNVVDRRDERTVLDRFDDDPTLNSRTIDPVVTSETLQEAMETVSAIYVADEIKEYVLDLHDATRSHPDILYGASTNASIMLLHASKAMASINGREYVIPEDVRTLVQPLWRHRLILTTEAELSEVETDELISRIVDTVSLPRPEFDFPESVTVDETTEDGS